MELEEMRAVWSEMSNRLDNQKKLTNKLIMEMTKERYRNKIGILSRYEGIGAIICFVAALLLVFHFPKLDTWYLMASGAFTVVYLVVLPLVVLRSIKGMKNIDLINNTYKDTLIAYTKKRKQFLLTQRVGMYLNFLLLVVSLPVLIKVFKGKDILIADTNFLKWYIFIMAIFLVFFSKWGYGRYKKITTSASDILKNMEDS